MFGLWGFLGGSVVKNLPASVGDTGSILIWRDPTCGGATKSVTIEPALRSLRAQREATAVSSQTPDEEAPSAHHAEKSSRRAAQALRSHEQINRSYENRRLVHGVKPGVKYGIY